MGWIRCRPSREPHRSHRDRGTERHRLVCRGRMDRRCHLVGETETEHGIHYRHCIHGYTSYRADLRGDLEKVEKGGRGADQVTSER